MGREEDSLNPHGKAQAMNKKPEILLKRAYDPPTKEDGTRILVDRLWPRGLAREKLDALWLKDLAPSSELRKWFHIDSSRWEEFERRYRLELGANPQAFAEVRPYLEAGRVTLVYGARSETRNHAIVLRDFLLERMALVKPGA